MKLACFSIDALDPGESIVEVNRLLGSHRIVTIDRELVSTRDSAFWAICVTYLPSERSSSSKVRRKIDYKEVLSEQDFRVYVRLRALRKEIAEREAVPPYALFTNQQLADMITQRVDSVSGLRSISGVGPARVEKYAEPFLAALADTHGELAEPEPEKDS